MEIPLLAINGAGCIDKNLGEELSNYGFKLTVGCDVSTRQIILEKSVASFQVVNPLIRMQIALFIIKNDNVKIYCSHTECKSCWRGGWI